MRDPIIEMMSQMLCEKCKCKCVFCDCWIVDLIQPERLSEKTSKEEAIV